MACVAYTQIMASPSDKPTAQVQMIWQRIRVEGGNNRPGSWEWRQIPASESIWKRAS